VVQQQGSDLFVYVVGLEGSLVLSNSGFPLAMLLTPIKHPSLGVEVHVACTLHLIEAAMLPLTHAVPSPSLSDPPPYSAVDRSPPLHSTRAHVLSSEGQAPLSLVQSEGHSLSLKQPLMYQRNTDPPLAAMEPGDVHAEPLDDVPQHEPNCMQSSSQCVDAGVPMAASVAHAHDRRQQPNYLACEQLASCRDAAAAAACAKAQRATVLVQVGTSWGSGVVVGCREGLVLTNAHVVLTKEGELNDGRASKGRGAVKNALWVSSFCWAVLYSVIFSVFVSRLVFKQDGAGVLQHMRHTRPQLASVCISVLLF
jgi:hypothetical protein